MIKARIIEESCSLFLTYGVKTTMDDIAKHLGISKRTIYENFKDKNELLIECTEHIYLKTDHQIKEILAQADNILIACLEIVFKRNIRVQQQGMKYIMDLRKYYPEIYKNHLLKFRECSQKEVFEFINQGIREDLFRDDINPVLASYLMSAETSLTFLEQFELIYPDFKLSDDSFSDVYIVESIFITFMRGIATIKGLNIIDDYIKENNILRR